jgi:hypothetical protein
MSAGDPVSWFMIERGWRVVDRDGDEIGRVDEILGDSTKDIFNGLSVTHGLLSSPRYVPAERVAEITDGCVRLDLAKSELERLEAHEEPPPSARIRP